MQLENSAKPATFVAGLRSDDAAVAAGRRIVSVGSRSALTAHIAQIWVVKAVTGAEPNSAQIGGS